MNEQYFGLKDDQVPLIVIQTNDGQKYLKPNLEPDHIAPWVKEYQVIHLLLWFNTILPLWWSKSLIDVRTGEMKLLNCWSFFLTAFSVAIRYLCHWECFFLRLCLRIFLTKVHCCRMAKCYHTKNPNLSLKSTMNLWRWS